RFCTTASPATTNPKSAAAVSDARTTIVFLLLQNPYIHATTNVNGKPISAALRSIASDSAQPSLRKLVGIQRLNPNRTSPEPIARHPTINVLARTLALARSRHRLAMLDAASGMDWLTSTATAP